MLVDETTNISGDEVSLPPESVPGTDDTQAGPTGDTGAGDFDSFFDEASAKAMTPETSDDLPDAEADAAEDIPTDDEPGDDTETDETEEEEKPDEEDESDKDSDDEQKKPDSKERRVNKYQEMKTRAETAEQRVTQLNEKLEKHGGIEAVEDVLNFFDKAMNAESVDEFIEEISALPHGARIQRQIFDSNLENPANRVYAVNNVLKGDFGLEKNLSEELMTKAFEFLAAKTNDDPEELSNFLDRELEYLPKKEATELERLRAEVESLKNPRSDEADKNAKNVRDLSDPNVQIEIGKNAQKSFIEYENAIFAEVLQPELAQYGLAPSKNDTPEIKQAKTQLTEMVKWAVVGAGFESEARMNIANMFVQREIAGADGEAETVYDRQARRSYRNMLRVNTQKALKNVSALIGKARQAPDSNGNHQSDKSREALDAAHKPKGEIRRQPKEKKAETFDSIFDAARTDR